MDTHAMRARQETAAQGPGPLEAVMTVEAALVTLAGVVRDRAARGDLALPDGDLGAVAAMQCEDEAHYHFLQALGAVPAASVFAIAPRTLATPQAALDALLALKELSVGAQMALARAVAAGGDPALGETLFAMGAAEGAHLAVLRLARGEELPNDRAFARWRFADPVEALAALAETGLLDDADGAVAYPGPLERWCRGVTGLVPETTEDAMVWVAAGEE